MADINLGEFLTRKHSLWLDLRTSDDDRLHGSCRRIENASEGITIQITKKAEATGTLNIYLLSSWMRNSILRMAVSSQRLINLLPQMAHSATIWVTGKQLDPLGPVPKLSDFYVPSTSQRNREIAFVVLGMAATT